MKKLKDGLISFLDRMDQGVSWLVGATLPVKVQEYCAEKRVMICGIGVAAAAASIFVAGPFATFNIIAASFCVNMAAAYCEDNVRKRERRASDSSSPTEAPAAAVEGAGLKMKGLSLDFSPARKSDAPEAHASEKALSGQSDKPAQKISP